MSVCGLCHYRNCGKQLLPVSSFGAPQPDSRAKKKKFCDNVCARNEYWAREDEKRTKTIEVHDIINAWLYGVRDGTRR